MERKERNGAVHITNLFEKYKNTLRAPQKTILVEFKKATKDILGVDLKPHHCTYSPHTKTLSLLVSGPIKTEILFKKKEILERIETTLGKKSAPREIL